MGKSVRSYVVRLGRLALFGTVAALSACGGGGGDGGGASGSGGVGGSVGGSAGSGGVVQPAADFAPMAPGDTWVYEGDNGIREQHRITGTRVIDGQAAYVMARTNLNSGVVETTAFRKTAEAVTEVPDGSNDLMTALGPVPTLRLPVQIGDSFTSVDKTIHGLDVDGDARSDPMTVRATVTVEGNESVTVPAGNFPITVRVRTLVTQSAVLSSNGQTITVTVTGDEWFAPDIGLVRSRIESTSQGFSEVENMALTAYRVSSLTNDSTPPKIFSTAPERGATVGRTVHFSVRFDEVIDAAALAPNAITLVDANGVTVATAVTRAVPGEQTVLAELWGVPTGTYKMVLDGSVADLVGNRVPSQQWPLVIDGTAPALVSSVPAADSTNVRLSSSIDLKFTEPVSLDTVSSGVEIGLAGSPSRVRFTPTKLDDGTVRLQPEHPLSADTAYVVRISTEVMDLNGNSGGPAVTIPFRTGAGPFQSLPVIVNGFMNEGPIAVGDVNGDGRADLVYRGVAPVIQVRRQLPDGTLDAGYDVPLHIQGLCQTESIQIADLNGDGRLDVAVAERGCGIELLLQNAAGVLEQGPFMASDNTNVIRAGDVNGDGRMDLVGAGSGTNVSIWLQASNGVLSSPTLVPLLHGGTLDMALGDANSDGRLDIAVSSGGHPVPSLPVVLLHQRADGGFELGGVSVQDTLGAFGVAIGDINGDGRADLVNGRPAEEEGLVNYRQDAEGRMLTMPPLPGFKWAGYIRMVDLNGDGRLDMVVRQHGLTPIVVAEQQPDGTMLRVQRLENQLYSPSGSDRLAVGDLNGDGLADIVMSGPLVIYANPSGAKASGMKRSIKQPARATRR